MIPTKYDDSLGVKSLVEPRSLAAHENYTQNAEMRNCTHTTFLSVQEQQRNTR